MKILYIGDIMGKPGRQMVKKVLPNLIREEGIDFVIAQGENLSSGKGLQIKAVEDMMAAGINFFTGGDWTLHREEIHPWLDDPARPLIRPANYPAGTPGRGYKLADTPFGKILVISLLGQTVGYRAPVVDNPLEVVDRILEETKSQKIIASVVNFHGDFSSEKIVIGQYLDGRVTAVVGDHWHIPTADARILPGGTAHITDVGMVGSRDSSLGIKTSIIVNRWKTGQLSRNELEIGGQMQFCSLLIDLPMGKSHVQAAKQIIIFG
ncbi:MAG TPA: TIGR00282 family metallophosphoesterase [Candidatus Saccharimonadia bacterium]|nr:TIGR00282 family metallophosphoesterase [Candidatus Saccharimonadia bacterium]